MKKAALFSIVCIIIVAFCAHIAAEEVVIKKFARPGPKPKLYYSAVQVDKTYYVAGTGDGRAENPDESYREKTKRCFDSIQKSLQMGGLDLENIIQAWVMLEDSDGIKDMTEVWKETFPNNRPARTTFFVANIPGPSQMEITAIAYTDLSERTIV